MHRDTAIVAWCTSDRDLLVADGLIEAAGDGVRALVLRRSDNGLALSRACGNLPDAPGEFATVADAWDWMRGLVNDAPVFVEAKLNNADLPPHTARTFLEKSREHSAARNRVSNFTSYTDAFFSYSESGLAAAEIKDDFTFIGPTTDEWRYYLDTSGTTLSAPKALCLDLSPQCDKRCAKCQFHSPGSPFKKYIPQREQMSLELARKLLHEAARFDPKPTFAPTFSGEPLVYPHLMELLREAKELGFNLSVTTNGMLLKPETTDQLLDIPVDSIMISLDATTQSTYAELQAPGKLDKVEENIRYLLDARKDTPVQVGLTFVAASDNDAEFPAYLERWSDVDYIVKSHRLDMLGKGNAVEKKHSKIPFKPPCFASLTSLYIRHDGRIALCGYDLPSKLVDLKAGGDMDLQQIWNSPEFHSVRDRMINPPHSYPFCNLCDCRDGQYLWETIEDEYRVTTSPITKVYNSKG